MYQFEGTEYLFSPEWRNDVKTLRSKKARQSLSRLRKAAYTRVYCGWGRPVARKKVS